MREIKFNFYDTIKKKYIRWEDSNAGMSMSAFITHEHLKFLQYTGLKDKNGREIYEGDICILERDEPPVLVRYEDTKGRFIFDDIAYEMEWKIDDFHLDELEVIGNRFEHPHLLEGGAG